MMKKTLIITTLSLVFLCTSAQPNMNIQENRKREKREIRQVNRELTNIKPDRKTNTGNRNDLLIEDFESGVFPPAGWSRFNLDGDDIQWESSTTFNKTPGGSSSAVHEYSTNAPDGQDGWLITPAVELPSGSFITLSFWSFNDFADFYTGNYVMVSTASPNPADGDFNEVWNPSSVIEAWVETIISLTSYAGQTVYIAFRYTGYDGHDWYLDDISITSETLPDCPAPYDLFANNITTNSADLGWIEIGSATKWNIEWDESGFAPGSGNLITGTTDNPYTLGELDPNTSYHFYVQADCGTGLKELSDWAGPYTFSTLCLAFELPFEEDFTGLSAGQIPECWSKTHENWFAALTNNAGGESPEMVFDWNPGTIDLVLLASPFINTSGYSSLILQFRHALDYYPFAEDDYTVGVKTSSDGLAWNTIWSISPNQDIAPEILQIEIDNADLGSESFRFAFFFHGDSYDINNWWIDDIMLYEHIPEIPENLTISDPITGEACYNATQTIILDGATVANGAFADFRSGGTITATGFEVEEGGTAYLTAEESITLGDEVLIAPGATGLVWLRIDIFEPCMLPPPVVASEDVIVPEELPVIREKESFFKVFPNPTTSTFKLELLNADEAKIIVEIYGIMGERVFQDVLFESMQYEFDLSNMPKGIYFIRLLKGDEVGIEKVIKQ